MWFVRESKDLESSFSIPVGKRGQSVRYQTGHADTAGFAYRTFAYRTIHFRDNCSLENQMFYQQTFGPDYLVDDPFETHYVPLPEHSVALPTASLARLFLDRWNIPWFVPESAGVPCT